MEVVHIKLPHERVHIRMFEMGCQSLGGENRPIEHLKGETVGCPFNDASLLALGEKGVKRSQEVGHCFFSGLHFF